MTENLIQHLGYIGIVLVLVLGGLGLPVPEEAPIILAAVLSKKETMWWPMALASCFTGVLVGDFVVYFLGYVYGEKVLGFPLTRKFLTRARESQIKGYFHRHGFKILILGRFAVGFRTAAYLTAGILRLPAFKLLLTDLFAASLSTLLMFGLGWRFAEWIEAGMKEAKHWIFAILTLSLLFFLLYRFYTARRRAGMAIGPPVYVGEDTPLPPDDLKRPERPSAAKSAAEPLQARLEVQPTPPEREAQQATPAELVPQPQPGRPAEAEAPQRHEANASSHKGGPYPEPSASEAERAQARPPVGSEPKS